MMNVISIVRYILKRFCLIFILNKFHLTISNKQFEAELFVFRDFTKHDSQLNSKGFNFNVDK